jgi:apolipoprotein N-acyltransferase
MMWMLQGRMADFLALLAGAALVPAFAPLDWFPLAILSPALLFILLREATPGRAFWRGWLYGVGMFGAGVSWVYVSFHDFGYMHPAAAGALTAAFVMGMALYPALMAYILVKLFPACNRGRLLLAAPALWTLLEWIRGWLFSGFPWLLLGYTQLDTPLAGFAPLAGVYGVSWATVFSASLLVCIALSGWQRAAMYALPAFILLWGSAALLKQAEWSIPLGDPISVALVQGNVPQEYKWDSRHAEASLLRYLELSRPHRDADLIIWPETAITLFQHQAGHVLKALERERREHGVDFLVGIPIYDSDKKAYYNSVISISEEPSAYHKRHLVPFGEYVPFRWLFGNLLDMLNAPMSDFSAGASEQDLLKAAGHRIGVSICYEDAFPGEVRRAMPMATLLVNVSNDAWFGDSIAPHQHLQIARMRALENGRYLLRATNTGISAIIDNKGQIVEKSRQFEMEVTRAEVQPLEGGPPYTLAGNGPILVIMLACLMAAVLLHYYWWPQHLVGHRPEGF